MKNKNQQSQIDLFTPFYEIFHEVCVLLYELGKELFIFGFRKITGKAPPLERIDRSKLSVSKTTEMEEALGMDTKTKKPLLLNEIDLDVIRLLLGHLVLVKQISLVFFKKTH